MVIKDEDGKGKKTVVRHLLQDFERTEEREKKDMKQIVRVTHEVSDELEDERPR